MSELLDPIERGELKAERWADENIKGGEFRCACGRWTPLDDGKPLSSDPYAMPVCSDCAWEALE